MKKEKNNKKTFEQIRKFNFQSFVYLKTRGEKTKFSYALKRTQEFISKILEDYSAELDILQVKHCLEDPNTKEILYAKDSKLSGRKYAYNKQGLMEVEKAERQLLKDWDAKEFEIKNYIATEIPTDLTEEEKEIFSGFVI